MKPSKYNLFIPVSENKYLLYNTLKGTSFFIDAEIKKILEKTETPIKQSFNDEVLASFYREGVIINNNVDEKNMLKVARDNARYHSDYLKYIVLTTYACNLQCPYCFEGRGETLQKTMTSDTTRAVIKYIKKKSLEFNRRKLFLSLFGGEPLVNQKACFMLLDELYPWCKKQRIMFNPRIFTNGTLITKPLIEKLLKYDLEFIRVTLDGPKHIHDKRRIYKNGEETYEKIINAISLISETNIPLIINISVDKDNHDYMEELLDDLKQRGLTNAHVVFSPIDWMTRETFSYFPACISTFRREEITYELQQLAEEKGFKSGLLDQDIKKPPRSFCCEAETKYTLIIDPFGDLYKCINFLGKKEHCIGTLDKDGNISKLLYPYYDLIARDPLSIERCSNCKLLPICGGGCACFSYLESGNYHKEGHKRCKRMPVIAKERINQYLKVKNIKVNLNQWSEIDYSIK